MSDDTSSGETVWDVARLTEATRASVPMAAQTRVEVVEAERGRVKLRMPIEGNGNHTRTETDIE